LFAKRNGKIYATKKESRAVFGKQAKGRPPGHVLDAAHDGATAAVAEAKDDNGQRQN
jgi:hypothetical protein